MFMNNYQSFSDWRAFWISWLVKYQRGTSVAGKFCKENNQTFKITFSRFQASASIWWRMRSVPRQYCSIYQNQMVLAQRRAALKITKYFICSAWESVMDPQFWTLHLVVFAQSGVRAPLLSFNQMPSWHAFCTSAQMLTISRALKAICVWREPRAVGQMNTGTFEFLSMGGRHVA